MQMLFCVIHPHSDIIWLKILIRIISTYWFQYNSYAIPVLLTQCCSGSDYFFLFMLCRFYGVNALFRVNVHLFSCNAGVQQLLTLQRFTCNCTLLSFCTIPVILLVSFPQISTRNKCSTFTGLTLNGTSYINTHFLNAHWHIFKAL